MRLKKLSELLDISIGRTPSRNEPDYWGEGHHWVSIRDLSSKTVAETKEQITDQAVKEARCKIVKKGTLLFSFKLTIGKMAFAGCDLYTNEAIAAFVIKDERKLNSEFLYYALQSTTYGGSNQAVMGKTLNSKSLADIEIPLPPLDDQIRIAHLLGKVEGLIAQRKQHLQQLDDLLKSVFLEMFGDVALNTIAWDIDSLSNFGQFKNGLNFGAGETGVQMRCLGVGDFKAHSKIVTTDSLSTINLNAAPPDDYFLRNGDLVFVRSNGSKDLVGRCVAVYPNEEKVTYSGFCIRYRLKPNTLDPTYLVHLFRSPVFRRLMLQGGQGANIQNINQKLLSALPIPVPPLERQRQFSKFVKKIEEVSVQYQRSLTNLESLCGALSQQAFKGELDLSRVPLPGVQPEEQKIVAAEPLHLPAEQVMAIDLSDISALLDVVQGPVRQQDILRFWLEAYRGQLGTTPFSMQHFMAAAQTRLAELHPDNDFELGANDYEYIKTWVFDALDGGALTQAFDDAGNRVELKAAFEKSPA